MADHIDVQGFHSVTVPASGLARGIDGPPGACFAVVTLPGPLPDDEEPVTGVCYVQSQAFAVVGGVPTATVIDGITDLSAFPLKGARQVEGHNLRITHPSEAVGTAGFDRATIFVQSTVDVTVQFSRYSIGTVTR